MRGDELPGLGHRAGADLYVLVLQTRRGRLEAWVGHVGEGAGARANMHRWFGLARGRGSPRRGGSRLQGRGAPSSSAGSKGPSCFAHFPLLGFGLAAKAGDAPSASGTAAAAPARSSRRPRAEEAGLPEAAHALSARVPWRPGARRPGPRENAETFEAMRASARSTLVNIVSRLRGAWGIGIKS